MTQVRTVHLISCVAGPAPHSDSASISIDSMSISSLPWVEAGMHLSGIEIDQRCIEVAQRFFPLRSDSGDSLLQLEVVVTLLLVAVDSIAQLPPCLAPDNGLLLQRAAQSGFQAPVSTIVHGM